MARLTAVAACHVLLWCCLVSAQEGTAPGQPEGGDQPPPKRPEVASPKVEESRPAVYYLKDEQGKLVAVPGFTFEEFEQLYKLRERLADPDQQPKYVLQSMSATGTAGVGHAELVVQVKVLAREDGWIRVPLGLDRALLRELAEYQGPGEGFVHFEDAGQGHVGWIRGLAGKQHELRLKVLVPLVEVGDETRLKLLAPRATVSQLKLSVPVSKAVGKVSEGAELVASSEIDQGTTEFTVLGLGGDFELTWHGPGRQPAEQPTVLEAEGTVLARIDARGVDTEATLKVYGSGAPFDRFQVRLPPGASLVPSGPTGPAGYSVAPAEKEKEAAAQPGLVEVRFKERKSGPVEVRLATWRPRELNQPEDAIELAGFEVLGAVRQWGHVDVAAAGDWQVLWGGIRGVQRVEPLPLEDVVAGFDYHAQPYSLTARLVPKTTRISVEPEYRLLVDASRVQLKATLKYTVRGAKAFKLDVGLPAGWESVEVEPATLVAVDGIVVTDGNVLSIPLLQPSTGKLELHLSAQWPIPEGSRSLVLPLPQPQVDWPGPVTVVVLPADNVQLTPNHASIAGLLRQPSQRWGTTDVPPTGSPPSEPLDRQQPPLVYRGEAAEAVFAADFSLHGQKITVDVTSLVSLDGPRTAATEDLPLRWSGKVQQKLAYRIDYEPADNLTVRVPRDLAQSGPLEFLYGGQPLTAVVLPDVADEQGVSGPVRMQIDLPKACIGACELEVRYVLRLGELVPGAGRLARRKPVVLPLPLVMPERASLTSNKLRVTMPAEVKATLTAGARAVWEEGKPQSGIPPGLQLSADRPAAQVELQVALDQWEGTTVVERAWVQTWLVPPARRDRAVFSFTSDQKELPLVVPAGAAMDRVQVLLDGKQVEGQPDAEGRLIVPLSGDAGRGRHLLELRADFLRERQPPGRLSTELPRLADGVPVYEMYWQLMLPWNEHLIAAPKGLTNEFAWQWDGCFWGRKPLLDQPELEAWVGLPPPTDGSQRRSAPQGMNCYLFSSMGGVERCELRTAWRSWILLSASGAALVAGLMLIYVPLTRHPATLFVSAVVLLCVGILYYPEPALLLAQAASLGLALALVAGLLERSVTRRRRVTAVLETPSAVLEKASTQTHYPAGSGGRVPSSPEEKSAGTEPSTQTAPAIVSRSTPDSNA